MTDIGLGNKDSGLPSKISRAELIQTSKDLLTGPKIKARQKEDVFRIQAVEMEWDLGVMVYEPEDVSRIPLGADGKKIGIFLLHGGAGDWRSMEDLVRLLVDTWGYKVVNMTYPGRLYLQDPSRNWPDDTVRLDGTVRTPIWKKDERIGPDQYDIGKDLSKRKRYGTRIVARAKPGTLFYDRMAGWPMAFEEGMKTACRRHFPENEYSVFVHGHSTGGPIVFMLSQRVPNVGGVLAVENSPFGYINEKKHNWGGSLGKVAGFERVTKKPDPRRDPFNELYIRTWRDKARYQGPEALGQEGPQALMRLPMLMEEIFEAWDQTKMQPNFKAEYVITHNIVNSLAEAAQVTAQRLKLNQTETEELVQHYVGYTRELTGPDVKPAPPVLFGITKDSRDHSPEVYKEVILPMFAAINPPPRTHVVWYGGGVHGYMKPEQDLPKSIGPALIKVWHQAFMGGYFVT